jgi:hypothetical protein
MAVITIFRNPFSSEFEQISILESIAIKDAVKFDIDNSLIFVNGFNRKENYILKEDDVCLIREFPGDPITFTAAVAATFVVYFIVDEFVGYFSGTGLTERIINGVKSWIGTKGATDLADTESTESLEKIPQLKGAKNQTGLGKVVPLVLGTHLLTPYYCGDPYTFIDPNDGTDGENQYICALYMIGYSDLIVSDIRLGQLQLASNTSKVTQGLIPIDGYYSQAQYSTALEIQQSAEVAMYSQKIVEERFPSAIELTNVDDVFNTPIRFSANNPQKIQVEIFINGLIGYSSTGEKEDRTIIIKAQWRSPGGDWVNFPAFQNCTAYSTLNGTTTFTKQKNKQMRFVSTYNFSYAQISAIPEGWVEIRMYRVNANATDSRTSDSLYWTAIRTWCYDKEASTTLGNFVAQAPVDIKTRQKTCRIGFTIKAGSDVSGTIDALNLICSSVARTFSGSAWTTISEAKTNKTVSNNPASCALLALQQPHIGKNPYLDSEIDLDEFGLFYNFCASKGFTCNGIVTSSKLLEDLINTILFTGRAQKIIKDGKIAPLIDNERAYPVTILNQQNTVEDGYSNTKEFTELPDGLRITFVDAADGYQTNERYVMYDGKSATDPNATFQDIELAFQTNRVQVWKNGRWILACLKLRPEVWTRKVSLEGYAIPIGALVEVQDQTISVGLGGGGEIKEIIEDVGGTNIIGIICAEMFDMVSGTSYGIKIVQADGINNPSIRTIQVQTIEGFSNQLLFSSPLSKAESIIPSVGDYISFGVWGLITTDAIVIGKKPSDDQTFELQLIPYNEGIYSADSGTIPDFDSKITPPIPISKIEEIAEQYVTPSDVAVSIQGVVSGDDSTIPSDVSAVTATASHPDYIRVVATWSGDTLSNAITGFYFSWSKNEGVSWEETFYTSNIFDYYYNRATDGYPETSDLAKWRFRVQAVNSYGKRSSGWGPSSTGTTVDYSSYLTWIAPKPTVTVVADETGLDVEYSCDESTFFGTATYSLYVKGALKLSGIVGKKTRYTFDRATDGYPEKVSNGGDLDTWNIVIRVSTEGGSTDSDTAHPDVSKYLTWKPPAPVVTAVAQEKTLELSWTINQSAYYGTNKTFKFLISSTTKKTGIGMLSYSYPWNRDVDGYPEKVANGGTLDNLNIYIVAVTAEYTTGTSSAVAHPDVSKYLTFKPSQPTISGSCGNRDASIIPIVGNQTYNHAGFRIQITRKGNAGVTDDAGFYALGNSENARIDETSYRSGSIGGYTFEAIASTDTIDQVLPLINQSAKLPVDTKYYYRIYTIVSVPTTASPTAGNVSLVSAEKLIIAKGTGNYDIVSKAVEEGHLGDEAVTNRALALLAVQNKNITNETIEMAKFAAGIRPPRVVTSLPVSPFVGYAIGDTVVLTTDKKIYRFTGTGWTKAIDGDDISPGAIDMTKFAASIRPPRVVSSLPANPYTGYAKGDTVVLTTDSKLYTLINVSLPGTTGWTRKIDGLDLIADTVTAGAVAAGAIGTRELAVGDGLNIMAYDLCSFENFADGYIPVFYSVGISSFLITTEKSLDGNKSLKIITASEVLEGYVLFAQNSTTYTHIVESDKSYILSCYVFSLTDCDSQIYVKLSNGTYIGTAYMPISSNIWTRIYLKFNVPAGVTSLLPRVDINNPSTTAYFDAFQLEECESTASEPSGYRSPGLTTVSGTLIKTQTINAHDAVIYGTITADELAANSVTAGSVSAGAIGTRELAVGDGLNIMAYDLCSFENFADGFIPVFQHYLTTASVSDTKSLDGNRSLKVIATGTSGSVRFSTSTTEDTHTVIPGQRYCLSCYVNPDTTLSALLYVRHTNGTISINGSYFSCTAGLWNRIYMFFTVPTGVTLVTPGVGLNAAGTAYFDAFQLEACNETASEPSGYRASGLTTIDGQLIKTRTIDAQTAIIEGSITANEVATNGLSATNLNVNARNILNSFIYSSDGTTGWTLGSGASFETVDGYRTLRLTTTGGSGAGAKFLSDEFTVNPTDIIKFSFGLSCPNYASGSGLFIGLTYEQTFKLYVYNFSTKNWTYLTTGTNKYFVQNYIETSRKNFGTYILGADVDISGVPAPDYTDTTYSIYCLQLSSGDSVARIRSGYDATTAGTYWRLFLPRAILTDSSKIVAEKIVVEKLSSITTNPGTLQGDDAANYKLVMSPSASETDPEGTFLLGAIGETGDASYFRRYKSGGIWMLDIKTSTFKVDSISSTILGNFVVQTKPGGVDKFLVYPDSYVGVWGIPFLVYSGAGGGYADGIRIATASLGQAGIELGTSWSTSGWQAGQCRIVKRSGGTLDIAVPNSGNTAPINALSFSLGGAATFVSHVYVGGTLTVTSNITMNSSGGIISGPYGEMIRSIDEWLRLNAGEQHTNGIYCGSSLLRTDGEFQIGHAGAFAKITASGAMTLNSTLTIGGIAFIGSYLLTNGKTSSVDGIAGEVLAGVGRIEISGATPLIDFHFANSTADYTTRLIEDESGVLNLIGTLRPSYLGRKTHSSGCLVGGFDNIGASETKVSPIYTIGSSYMPNDTSVENLRGIFFSHSNFWGTNGINARTGWGLGLASGGGIYGLLTENGLWTDGDVYAAGNIQAVGQLKGATLNITGAATITGILTAPSGIIGDVQGYATTSGMGTVVCRFLVTNSGGTLTTTKAENVSSAVQRIGLGHYRVSFLIDISTNSIGIISASGTSSISEALNTTCTIYASYADIYFYTTAGLTEPGQARVAIIGDYA